MVHPKNPELLLQNKAANPHPNQTEPPPRLRPQRYPLLPYKHQFQFQWQNHHPVRHLEGQHTPGDYPGNILAAKGSLLQDG